MRAARKKPELGKKETSQPKADDDSPGCIWIPVVIVVSYIVLSAILRVTSNAGSRLDQFICYGALAVFVVIMILSAFGMYQDGQAAKAERQQWKNGCISTEVAILCHRYYAGATFEDGYGDIHSTNSSYHLELDMTTDQRAAVPNQSGVEVEVNSLVYEKLKNKNTVRIYYKPEAPLTFLLEEEI